MFLSAADFCGSLSYYVDINGDYLIENVPPGTLTVAEEMQGGWEQIYPGVGGAAAGEGNSPISVVLRQAIDRAANLNNYTAEELASATEWVVGAIGDGFDLLPAAISSGTVSAAGPLPGVFIWKPTGEADAADPITVLTDLAGADFFFPLLAHQQSERAIPNDPLFGDQWHLLNTGQSGGTIGADANVEPAWDSGIIGTGSVIAIVDDGLQYTHPDLASQYAPALSYDFNDADSDPSPAVAFDWHGTAVAGVAGATFNNSLGVSGADG